MDQDSENQNVAATQNTEITGAGVANSEPDQPVPDVPTPDSSATPDSVASSTNIPSQPTNSVSAPLQPTDITNPTTDQAGETSADSSNPETSTAPSTSTDQVTAAPSGEPSAAVKAAAAELEQAQPVPSTPIIAANPKARKLKATASKKADTTTADPSSTSAASANSNPTTPIKKKSKAGLIIAIIIAILLVLGVVGAIVWFFVYYNNPEKIAFDAVSGVLSAENVALNGEVIVSAVNDSDTPINRIALTFDSASIKTPTAGKVELAIDLKDDPDFNAVLDYVQAEDGIIYIKIEGIMAAIDAADLDKEIKNQLITTLELAEEIDGEWWEISVADVMRSLDVDRSSSKLADELYTCAIDTSRGDYTKELADIYREHRFVEVEKIKAIDTDGHWFTHEAEIGSSLYQVDFNKRELAAFINTLPKTQAAEDFVDCYNSAMKDYFRDQGYNSRTYGDMLIDLDDFDDVMAYDIKIPDEVTNFYLQISNWGHKLQRAIITDNEKSYHASINIMFDYRKPSINLPDNYKPLTDLIDDDRIQEAFEEILMLEVYGTDPYMYYDEYGIL